MARKREKKQTTVDAAPLLDDPDLAESNELFVKMGLTLDPKARWYRAKAGRTLVLIWRGDNIRAIRTVRFRVVKEKKTHA